MLLQLCLKCKKNDKKKTENNSDRSIVPQEIEETSERAWRSIDVYAGPVLCAKFDERPGFLNTIVDKSMNRQRSRHFNYVQIDENTEDLILMHVKNANSFSNLIFSLLSDKLDIASSHEEKTHSFAGRCLSIKFKNKKIGSLWDHAGQLSCLNWQPCPGELDSPWATLTAYVNDVDDPHFLNFYKAFKKGECLGDIRLSLIQCEYELNREDYRSL
eukprot:gb/GECH01008303.1/.p1 GENE.gb/GECH01008303.1/~~gb/GECH01008303.1/.p1  ORF type:complete len:215 (+),score=51.58 gb/GECH01008303.1/:1-645(+)